MPRSQDLESRDLSILSIYQPKILQTLTLVLPFQQVDITTTLLLSLHQLNYNLLN